MKVLAFDSTGPILTAAVADGGVAFARHDRPAERGRGNSLDLLVDQVLKDASWARADVEGIALVTGPGSLTATRIGWATAAGWAQAAGIPVIGWRVPEVQARRWQDFPNVYCCVHYRANLFLLYDLEGRRPFTPQSVSLDKPCQPNLTIGTLTGPGLVGNYERWDEYLGGKTIFIEESALCVGADRLAQWGEEALSRGEHLPLDRSPLDYGLPPDFKTLISK